ncbi:MAG: DNA polymerase III subunit beta [Candidatus Omnitrophica bacterium]|nr:DNA polymerase III subunit beta [Candidatus Omnitrophota bacterium]
MKVRCSKEILLNGVQVVYTTTTLKSTLPILSNILLETKKDTIRLTATDLDIGIINDVAVKIEMEGAVTIPAKRFFDIIKETPQDKEIIISAKKNNIVNIECENLFFKLIGLPKEEFPKLPEFKDKDSVVIPQQLLKKMLTMTSFAMSYDQTRYVLNGSLFMIGPKTLKVAATDGRRLAVAEGAVQAPKEFEKAPKNVIIPAKAVSELLRTLGGGDNVKMTFSENQALFNLGQTTIISRLVEGEFPKYEQVIPKEAKDKLKVSSGKLFLAVKRASILTNQESQAIKLELFKDRLVVSKVTPELGESREELPVEYGGPGLVIGFNPNYLLDALKNLDKPDIAIEFSSPEKPAVIRTEDGYVYVVLPMQIT